MPANHILEKMLDRLYASLIGGPSLNCRPHSSRQRVDLTLFTALGLEDTRHILTDLLNEQRTSEIIASIPAPQYLPTRPDARGMHFTDTTEESEQLSPEQKAEIKAWNAQKSLMTKLRNLSEDARTYEQDTGVPALQLGFPILSMPPAAMGGSSRRILAPIAFIPMSMEVAAGRHPGVKLACRGDGVDRVTPNPALMAWLERETGKTQTEFFEVEEGAEPWREVRELIEYVCAALDIPAPDPATTDPQTFQLINLPRAEELPNEAAIINGAVLGLFPTTNQGLLRDTRAMLDEESIPPTVTPFVDVNADLTAGEHSVPEKEKCAASEGRDITKERFVSLADPFQARAVDRARNGRAVVIHGPPGTGKSQTITNIIGDHLANDQRVLFVCDKRTALDVVANRLDHLGLGRLCALVHDAKRDQRDLYMKIRANLDDLNDVQTRSRSDKALNKIDDQLTQIHNELTSVYNLLMKPADNGSSFHDLVGQWLSSDAPTIDGLDEDALATITLDLFENRSDDIEVIFQRAESIGYETNPWANCAGGSLDDYLTRPIDELRRVLASCIEDARVADNTKHENIPPFDPDTPLPEQVELRKKLTPLVERIGRTSDAIRKHVLAMDGDTHRKALATIRDSEARRQSLDKPLDSELSLVLGGDLPNLRKLNEDITLLKWYQQKMQSWTRIFAFGLKSKAGKLLGSFGLGANTEDANKLEAFFTGLRDRLLLTHTTNQLLPADTTAPPTPALSEAKGRVSSSDNSRALRPDDELIQTLDGYACTLGAIDLVKDDTHLTATLERAIQIEDDRLNLLDGLKRSPARAEALQALEQSMRASNLFNTTWLTQAFTQLREGKQAGETLAQLEKRFDTLESVLRIHDGVSQLPENLAKNIRITLTAGIEPGEAVAALIRCVLAAEVRRRLQANPELNRLDSQRLTHLFSRYHELEEQKRVLVRDYVLDQWIEKQRSRLLAMTGSRLNSAGADLRRRLFVRGKRAMRLRQMIAVGRNNLAEDETDALFDMCPIWMASPETVAQVFPREPLFDVVIFDEASQCRLEEALPVLTRAKRVVIAGDPKQLPPTRFFEAAISVSEDEELETEQDLFEAQQAEVEDLLAAALNLQVEEAYLDVHYRSRNADLIEFSNEHFYKNRLQSIPGHPKNRAVVPPLRIDRADGVYENRCNSIEAERVVQIVDDLLRRADPPSIGIACFNITQRDLIVDMLDDRAVDDDAFASRLAKARARVGEASYEGLFVKNLENVQGDERDHIIISTTYGPNKEGKFYRRFGPLGRTGGGRRLNVLVTRARQEVHLVTSIPRENYLSVENLPAGAAPSGAWLLFAYLRYAEQLAELYDENNRILEQANEQTTTGKPSVIRRPIPPVSGFAMALGQQLAEHKRIGCDMHWGNEAFCIDVALHHPQNPDDVTVGLLCDFTRYDRAPDPIEWELYRQSIFQWTGWQFTHIWTPHFFRDPVGAMDQIQNKAQEPIQKPGNKTE